MRITKRMIAFVLVAVLMLALLPTTAFADPPQSDPTHKHKWKVVSGTEPTCTEDGKKTWKCSACGKTYTETIAALGHDWDEGAVTADPLYFTAGERTYTCKRDPSHTKTEAIETSAESIFAHLHGYSWSWMPVNIDPLIVTEQPVGGAITRYADETVTLHVAASGGQGSYTYEWYSKPLILSAWLNGAWSWTKIHCSGELTEPDYEASEGGRRYWCVVTDEAGNTAASDTVVVDYKISIAKQPDNVNLQGGNPTLSCEAMDGSGDYTYRWYNSDLVFQGQGASRPVSEEGDYFCTVEDNVTGDTVDSEMCTVYSAEPFTLVYLTGDGEHDPEGSGMLAAEFKGGVTPYEIWWDKDGEAIESYEGEMNENYGSVVYNATVDDYTVHAVDAMGEVITATSHRTAPKLTIVEQPQGGMIPKDSYTRINVVVADGEAPYTFILYRNGEECLTETDDSDSCPYGVWDPGEYYYHIEDSQGRSVDSDVVYFENAVFRVKKQTESAEIAKPEGTAKLEVEVEGGAEPYTYEWTVGSAWSWFKTGANEPTLTAKKPGYYSCRIKDKDGGCIKSKTIKVSYTGKKPWILSVTPDRIIGAGETTKLTCTAISGTGDDSNLRYDWYSKKPDGGWTLFSANAQTTETAFARQYRCKVTDTVSGEYSTSVITTVSEELVLTDIIKYQESKSQSFALYTLSFRGGTAPYACTVYLKYPYWNGTATEYKDVIEDVFIVNSLEELKQREWFSALENQVWYIENTPIGERYAVEYAQHYLVIYDASGQKVKSPIFTYRDS